MVQHGTQTVLDLVIVSLSELHHKSKNDMNKG